MHRVQLVSDFCGTVCIWLICGRFHMSRCSRKLSVGNILSLMTDSDALSAKQFPGPVYLAIVPIRNSFLLQYAWHCLSVIHTYRCYTIWPMLYGPILGQTSIYDWVAWAVHTGVLQRIILTDCFSVANPCLKLFAACIVVMWRDRYGMPWPGLAIILNLKLIFSQCLFCHHFLFILKPELL
jgi:hypothetical protein